jgi:hypothetical protein
MMKKGAVSHLGLVSLAVVLLGVSAVGLYFSYALGHSSTTNGTVNDAISLQNFVLNPVSSNLSGTIYVNSSSQIEQMRLYMNGTYLGSSNYSSSFGMMSMMKNYPNMYYMMYSAGPLTFPSMSQLHFTAGRAYIVTMMAVFRDGHTCNASEFVFAK